MDETLRGFKQAVLARRVAARFMQATEFPTEEAREKYLKEHPKADPKKHTVKKQEGGGGEGKGQGEGEKKPKAEGEGRGEGGGKKDLPENFTPKSQAHYELGGQLQQWHGPGDPAITSVGSYLTARKPVPRKKLLEAVTELEKYVPLAKANKHGWGKSEVKELEGMIKKLKHLHDNE